MVLPVYPRTISLGQIRNEFNGPTQVRLGQHMYAGAGYVPAGTVGYPKGIAMPIPSSGVISIGDFHGSRRAYLVRYTSNGTFTVPSGITRISVLVIGGGGGGGSGGGIETGGGGGAGGVRIIQNLSVSPGASYSVVIGRGGRGVGNRENKGVFNSGDPLNFDFSESNGLPSSFGSYSAAGGGAGGAQIRYTLIDPWYGNQLLDAGTAGQNGGSGGGGKGWFNSNPGGHGTSGQGNAGAYGWEESQGGGGGGRSRAANNSNGAPGIHILLENGTYSAGLAAGGGAGGASRGSTLAGNGASSKNGTGGSASANSGCGGGGGGWGDYSGGGAGGAGGSGVVYVWVNNTFTYYMG